MKVEVALLESSRVDDGRPRHRNTGAKMVMDGCTNGDRVDEVRVGHVRRVGHSVVLARLRSRVFIKAWLKKFQIGQKVSDVVTLVNVHSGGLNRQKQAYPKAQD